MYLIKKVLYIILGSLCLVLGSVGIFLPILPTTPFLLLSSYFYVRSSEKLYNWLINHKIFGRYIYNYVTYKAVPKKAKITAILMIIITVPIAVVLIDNIYTYIIIPIIALIVCIYILKLKTLDINK